MAQPVAPARAAASSARSSADRVRALRTDLAALFGTPQFSRAQWGIMVQSLDSGEVLYSDRAASLLMPASNMKIVTVAAAAERLGWDFTYETRLITTAPVENGVLRGDLVVVGSGDPTMNRRGGSATRVFDAWAEDLRKAGIDTVAGRVVADGRAFSPVTLGAGWAWDDMGEDYSAGVSALQFDENVADVTVDPGPTAGAPAVVAVRPSESGLTPENRVTTVADGDASIELSRVQGSNRLVVSGRIPVGAKQVVEQASVDRPLLYFARMLRSTLMAHGIRVSGDACEYDEAYRDGQAGATGSAAAAGAGSEPAAAATGAPRVLATVRSAPLPDIARVLMKVSQNLYAETLLRTLGARAGDGTAEAGRKVVKEVLDGWGIPQDAYVMADGSGLSRYDYLCAEMLVKILRRMHDDPRHSGPFIASLPVGGRDGTLARRFPSGRAAGNVRAKTGSISNVRALSGYVTTADGETLAFSFLANGFTVPQSTVDATTDKAVERLAEFTRR